MQLEFLGTRGSMPVSGKQYSEFGGATACVRILSGNQEIYIDGGTGIVDAVTEPDTEITIFLTHMHLDHVLGLPFFKAFMESGRKINIYGKTRKNKSVEESLDELFRPPFWPVRLSGYPAAIKIFDLPEQVKLGDVAVTNMDSQHPGGSTIFKFEEPGATFVYVTDYEHGAKDAELTDFARGASLLVYDGQYSAEEYDKHKGFGHSTPDKGLEIAKAAGIEKMCITHHNPAHSDESMRDIEKKAGVHFLRCGETVEL